MSELQQNDPRADLLRANKVTAYWQGDGMAVGVFYKTHDKIKAVNSTEANFTFPEGTDEAPITAQQKLEAFKVFLMTNSSSFGILYDPIDRRADEFKFPNKYDQASLAEFSKKMLEKTIGESLEKVNGNVIANMIKSGHLPEGTQAQYGVGDGAPEINESYSNGSIKYATVKYPVVFAVGETRCETTGTVNVVSGQLKKPRELQDCAITMTGLKTLFIEKGLLPKVEKPAKEDPADETAADATDTAKTE
jgi:hypothetical protein